MLDGLKVLAFEAKWNNVVISLLTLNAVSTGDYYNRIYISQNLSANAIDGSVFSQQIKVVDDHGRFYKQQPYIFKNQHDNDTENDVYINEDPTVNTDAESITTLTFDDRWKLLL